jgi:DNA-binding TFAR19-related protein (PDSD5 family)
LFCKKELIILEVFYWQNVVNHTPKKKCEIKKKQCEVETQKMNENESRFVHLQRKIVAQIFTHEANKKLRNFHAKMFTKENNFLR